MHPVSVGGVGTFVPHRLGKSRLGLSMIAVARTAVALTAMMFAMATFAASNVIEYTRDAAGNITGVARQAQATLTITGFAPGSGPIGTSVTIYGAAFSATPASNTVAFNGTSATVTASTSASITTTVPSGATTGRITVTVGGITATSSQDFVVTSASAPTITGFSPASGASGTSISVTGTNFDTGAGATTAKVNGVTGVTTVASTTALSFPIPASASSGKITVTTSAGTATSASDLIIPPAGVNAADIIVSRRVSVDGASGNVALGTPNKHAIVLFDGAANAYLSIQFSEFFATSPTTAIVNYKVMSPDNSVLMSGTVGNASRPSIHLPKLVTAGTYSVLLSPGLGTLNTNVRVVTNPTLVVDGASVSAGMDYVNQSARFLLNATAGERIGVGVVGLSFTPSTDTATLDLKFYKPDGTLLSSVTCNGVRADNPQGNCDAEFVATVAGTYTAIAESPAAHYGNLSLQLNSDVQATLTADTTQDVTLARVGQDGRYTFAASVGDSLGIDVSASVPQPQAQQITVVVLKPDGTTLVSCPLLPPAPSYCELGTLAVAGTYTVQVDPRYGAYGTLKLTLKQGAVLSAANAPTAFAPPAVPESVRVRIATTAGQNLTIGVAGLTYVGSGSVSYLTVYRPDRSTLATTTCNPPTAGGSCKLTLASVPAGTYGVVLAPPAGVKLSGSINRSDEITGTLVAGTPQSVSATRAGQNARFTFSGTAGDSTAVKLYGVSTTPSAQNIVLSVYGPTGTYIAGASLSTNSSVLVNLPTLPTTGTYTVLADPLYGITWQGQLALDPGTLVTVDGSAVTLATATAGEPLRYRFAGTAAQRLEFGLTGLTYAAASSNPTGVTLYRPDGTSIMTASCATAGLGSCESWVASLPSTGTYSLVVAPPSASSITAGSMALSTPATGSFTIGGSSQTVAITRAGQTARYTFSGTSGQLLRLNWSSVTVASSATVSVSVLKPDGTTLSSSSFVNGATGGFDVASLPSTGTYTVVFDPTVAATMSAPVTLVTR